MAGGNPFAVEIDLVVDEIESQGPLGELVPNPGAVIGEELLTVPEGGAALLYECGVFAHRGDRHAGLSEAIDEFEPVDVQFAVYPASSLIPENAGDKSLRLVPTNGVNAASGAFGEFTDVEALGHELLATSLELLECTRGQANSPSKWANFARMSTCFGSKLGFSFR